MTDIDKPVTRIYPINPQQLGQRMIMQMVAEDAERGIPWAKCADCGEPYPIGSTDGPLVLAEPYVRGAMFCSKNCELAFGASLLG